jgi:stage V sporulation protein G
MNDDTTDALVTLIGFERVSGSDKLVALAVVEIEIAGVPIRLQGVKIVKRPDGRLGCEPPCFKAPDGRWLPAVILPPDLGEGLAAEVFSALAREGIP